MTFLNLRITTLPAGWRGIFWNNGEAIHDAIHPRHLPCDLLRLLFLVLGMDKPAELDISIECLNLNIRKFIHRRRLQSVRHAVACRFVGLVLGNGSASFSCLLPLLHRATGQT